MADLPPFPVPQDASAVVQAPLLPQASKTPGRGSKIPELHAFPGFNNSQFPQSPTPFRMRPPRGSLPPPPVSGVAGRGQRLPFLHQQQQQQQQQRRRRPGPSDNFFGGAPNTSFQQGDEGSDNHGEEWLDNGPGTHGEGGEEPGEDDLELDPLMEEPLQAFGAEEALDMLSWEDREGYAKADLDELEDPFNMPRVVPFTEEVRGVAPNEVTTRPDPGDVHHGLYRLGEGLLSDDDPYSQLSAEQTFSYLETVTMILVGIPRTNRLLAQQVLGKRRTARNRLQTKFAAQRKLRIEQRDQRRTARKEQEKKLRAEGKLSSVDVSSHRYVGDLINPDLVTSLPLRWPGHPFYDELVEIARALAYNPRIPRPTKFTMIDAAARNLLKFKDSPSFMPLHHQWTARQKAMELAEGRNH
ncbi:MAG: hypothetical protein Q8P67_10620 [archaeon]|nr:hypothetical protein [archaeon]